jgi:2-dehydropantoate 2-reductase
VKSILIVGPGAVGSLLAFYADRNGKAVYLLGKSLKSDQKKLRREISFKEVSGKKFKVSRNLFCARDFNSRLPVSAAFFCVKNPDISKAAKAALKYIPADSPLVFLQNGLKHPALIRKIFNSKNVVIGTCYAAAEKTFSETVVHHGGRGMVLSQNRGNREAVRRVASLLSEDRWDVSIEKDEEKMLWKKLCLNASVNPLGALAKATNGEIGSSVELRMIAEQIMRESLLVAKACGQKISQNDMKRLLIQVCQPDSEQRNSTLQDIEKGKRTEMKQILSPILIEAKRRRIEIPVLKRVARMIFKLEDYVCQNF